MSFEVFGLVHANLDFSSIPVDNYGLVLDTCYWPLVEALDAGVGLRLGLEFPISTLEILEGIDPTFVPAVRDLIHRGVCEPVASGMRQIIGPLVPAVDNLANLVGAKAWLEDRFGVPVTLAYANEQTVSRGIVEIYEEAGYAGLVLDWENTAELADVSADMRWECPRLGGSNVRALWASSVLFQKLQRVAFGQLGADEVLDYIKRLDGSARAKPLCVYSNDIEIFDYRPGAAGDVELIADRAAGQSGPDLKRFLGVLELVASQHCRGSFALPSEALRAHASDRHVPIGAAARPIATKKQPKYNVVRWAACGRNATATNTRSFQLSRDVMRLEELGVCAGDISGLRRSVVDVWRSDARTHTTDEKMRAWMDDSGAIAAVLYARLEKEAARRCAGSDVVVVNTSGLPWQGDPFGLKLRFHPGEIVGAPRLACEGEDVSMQAEHIERYRDGSVRCADIVIAGLALGRGDAARLSVGAQPSRADRHWRIADDDDIALDTRSVELILNRRRGLAVDSARFPALAERSLFGTVAHGDLTPIALSPDWYTGHTVIHDQLGRKHTDLAAMAVRRPVDEDAWPIRVPVCGRLETEFGTVWKTHWAHTGSARIDLDIRFRLRDLIPTVFRTGFLTLRPDAIPADALEYVTHNGGWRPERRLLAGEIVDQDEPLSPAITSTGCVGATEGWLALGGGGLGVTFESAQERQYVAMLLHHEPVAEGAFVRVIPSLAESDETSHSFFRGHTRLHLTFGAFAGDPTEHADRLTSRARGLLVAGRRVVTGRGLASRCVHVD